MTKRVFLIVLDSVGIGAMPDAKAFGDEGVNTLKSIAQSKNFHCPNLTKLGLFHIDGTSDTVPQTPFTGAVARLAEKSQGKDTIIGHWEIAGIVSPKAMPTFANGFPPEFIEKYEKAIGKKTICNLPYSGTAVLDDYGQQHIDTGAIIVYTSADSVFQVAAHEDYVPVEKLYEYCEIARTMLKDDLAVGRVIARPFKGDAKQGFVRTTNRHDYALSPPRGTMLTALQNAGKQVIGVGKIYDIFNGQGITQTQRTKSNAHGMQVTAEYAQQDFNGLCFVNLVDFDMLYGHRRDIDAYAAALTAFDEQLPSILDNLHDDDIVMLTADHGCDPAYTATTDHTREYVPLIMFGKHIQGGVNLGTVQGFDTIASTVCEALQVPFTSEASSLLPKVKK